MPKIFVADLAEFMPVVTASRQAGHTVNGPRLGYWEISSSHDITLRRKELGLGPALWYTCLMGGIQGRLVEYGRDALTLAGD